MNNLSDLQNKKLGWFELIATGFDLYLKNFQILVSLLCITKLPFLIIIAILQPSVLLLNPGLSALYYFIILFSSILVYPFYTTALAIFTESFVIAEKTQLKVVFKRILHRILPLVGLNIKFLSIYVLGFLLLIVPGIIYAVNNGYYTMSFILRDQRGEAAFQYSRSLVKGNWWRVFFFYLLISLITFGLQVIMNKLLSSIIVSPILIAVVSSIIVGLVSLGMEISSVLLFLNLEFQKR